MKIIFPVAGLGSRFHPHSSVLPKCLLPVRKRLMLEWAMESIWHQAEDVVFICHRRQQPLISDTLAGLVPRATVVIQTENLKGVSHTLLQAADLWRDSTDVVVVDCDIYADSDYRQKGWQALGADGSVLTFNSSSPAKSYVQIGDGRILRAVEKQVISNWAIGGIYHFRSGAGLLDALEKQIKQQKQVDSEYYLSIALDIYRRRFPNIVPMPAKKFHDLGTPETVAKFESLCEDDL